MENTHESYRKQLAKCLAIMLATLDTYGKRESGALLDGWTMALLARGFSFELLEPTCAWFCTHGADFPKPAEFMDRGYELDERKRIDVLLASTTKALKEADALAAADRRRKNIEAGMDPEEMLPIDAVLPVLAPLSKMLAPRPEPPPDLAPQSPGDAEPLRGSN